MYKPEDLDFFGTHFYNMDDKGRVSVPPPFKYAFKPDNSQQNEVAVLARGLHGCVFGFPMPVWQRYMKRAPQIGLSSEKYLRFIRKLYASAALAAIDQQGRIKIPTHLIEHGKLGKDIMIIGMQNRFEIWNPEVYKEYESRLDADDNEDQNKADLDLFVETDRHPEPVPAQSIDAVAPHEATLTG